MPYGGLIVVMMMSFLLVTAEFLPNGVLTEMAASLGVTPGQAGQTVTVTALVGLLVAPTIGLIFPRLDRRSLLVWMALAAAVSNLIVAISPNLVIVLLARFLLGAAISAFWSMSITVAARIAGPERLGRAVMFTAAGTSLATVMRRADRSDAERAHRLAHGLRAGGRGHRAARHRAPSTPAVGAAWRRRPASVSWSTPSAAPASASA